MYCAVLLLPHARSLALSAAFIHRCPRRYRLRYFATLFVRFPLPLLPSPAPRIRPTGSVAYSANNIFQTSTFHDHPPRGDVFAKLQYSHRVCLENIPENTPCAREGKNITSEYPNERNPRTRMHNPRISTRHFRTLGEGVPQISRERCLIAVRSWLKISAEHKELRQTARFSVQVQRSVASRTAAVCNFASWRRVNVAGASRFARDDSLPKSRRAR